ncbi:CDP-diacylglycerol--glycerol-3-phosphate 3-phosphatidyltransferase [Desulfofalx alkaliphila]|uniref:CDP-diacylglycerol--glycerol-3-phosphate 3-phosphatidyltransferase n=1 Tax=Desulfofalx alkaliphila TaxID=105483 RepID=UPI0004E1CECC|nr:CDP-diacylglycerol--glycerol-3-phosphate 3-phosphatidyltransferase [Desulfofalx alkaliphila]
MNLPNRLTLARIFLVPVFLLVVTTKLPYGDLLAAAVFILAASTDGLDGYFARKNKMVTRFGKVMDPLADKLLVTAALVSLVGLQRLSPWVAVIIIGREFAVSGLRTMAASEGTVIAASKLGKYKTVSQIIAIVVMFIPQLPYYSVLGNLAMTVAVVFTIWSGIDYFAKNWQAIKKGGL